MSDMILIDRAKAKLVMEALTKNSDRVTEIRTKDQAIAAMQEALAEKPAQQQEPVSGVVIREGLPSLLQDRHIKPTDQRLYTAPQVQHIPDAIHHTDTSEHPEYIAGFNDFRALMLEILGKR